MQKPDAYQSMPLAKGQYYQVNSFDLGFINIAPTDLLLEIRHLDPDRNDLLIFILPLPGQDLNDSMVALAKWFTGTYQTLGPDDCLLRNAAAFSRLVNCGLVTLYHSAVPAGAPTMLTQIQQHTPWPSLPNNHPHTT